MYRLFFLLSPFILCVSTLERAVRAVSEPEKNEEQAIKKAKPKK
jgi:hypothetical protein